MTNKICLLICFIVALISPKVFGALVTKAGTIDTSFSVPCFSKSVPFVKAFAIQSNGKIVSDIGAYNSNNCAQTIGRFNTDGTLDNTFLSPFLSSNDLVLAIAKQADEKFIVGGKFGSGSAQYSVARLNTNGTFDTNFTRSFHSDSIYVAAITLLSDDKILIGGYTYPTNGASSNEVVRTYFNRLNADGTVDSSFTPGISSEGGILAITVQPDGKYLVGGQFNTYLGAASPFLVRLEGNGARDASFQSPFVYSNYFTYISAISVLPDARILTAGRFRYTHMSDTLPNPVLLRLNPNGSRDITFKSAGDEKGQNISHAIALQPDGKILMASDFGLYRFNTNGTADTTFGASGDRVAALNLTSVALQDDKRIIAAGGFSTLGGKTNLHGLIRMFNDPVTSLATLTTSSNGSISPNLNGQLLEIGKFYTVTANPISGYLFSEWSDGSRNAKLTFQMQSNLNLVASFVPNPFLQSFGTYSGLFYDTNSPSHESAGAFSLKVANKGKFSGKIWSEGLPYSMAGQFYFDETAQMTVVRKGKTPLQLSLLLTNNQILGAISSGSFTSDLFGHRATFLVSKGATNFAGKYNFVLPGADDSSPAPSGNSFGSVSVTANGNLSIKGSLSDGTVLGQKTFVAENGEMPVYVPLYAGKGSIFGWLTLTNSNLGDLHGGLLWTKTAAALGKIYLSGFTNAGNVIGSQFNATSSVPLLAFTNAVALLENGNLTESVPNSIALDSNNKVFVNSTNPMQFKLTINPSAGQFKGTFLNTGTGKVSPMSGVLLQKQNIGAGFFLGTNQSGSVYLGEPENVSWLDSEPDL